MPTSLIQNGVIGALTKEQRLARDADSAIRQGGMVCVNVYRRLRGLLHFNPEFVARNEAGEVVRNEAGNPVYDLNASYGAFVANTTTGMSAEQLGFLAKAYKGLFNSLEEQAPIVDDVPPALILDVDASKLTVEQRATIKAQAEAFIAANEAAQNQPS